MSATSGVTATWQAASQSLSGDWLTAAHWTPASVPGAAGTLDAAFVGPGLSSMSNWSVTVANVTLAALTFDAAQAVGSSTLGGAGTLLVSNTLSITGTFALDSGAVSDGGLLAAGTILQGSTNGGTLQVGAGDTLRAQALVQTGGTIQAASGAVISATSAANFALGNVALTGATLTAGSVTDQSVLTLAGGAASIGGLLSVGADAPPGSVFLLASPGTLGLSAGATVAAGTLDLLDNSLISLDSSAALAIGGAAAAAGTVAVGTTSNAVAASGTIAAALALAGTLSTRPDLSSGVDLGNDLVIAGALTGTGLLLVGSPGGTSQTVELGNAQGFQGTISLDPGTQLILDSGGLPGGALAMKGATVELRGLAWGGGIVPAYVPATGLLTLGTLVLDVGTGLQANSFVASQGTTGDTVVTINSAATWQVASGSASGIWSDPAHWNAVGAPGFGDMVTIGPGVTSAAGWTVSTGTVQQAALSLLLDPSNGTLALTDVFTIGGSLEQRSGVLLADAAAIAQSGSATLNGSAQATLTDAAVWQAGGLSVGASGTAGMTLLAGTAGSGSSVILTDGLALGQAAYLATGTTLGVGVLSLSGGSNVVAQSLTLANGSTLGLDASSDVQLGSASVVAGGVALGGVAQLVAIGNDSITGNLADNAFISVQPQIDGQDNTVAASGLVVAGTLSGNGVIDVQSRLEIAAAPKFNGTITLEPGATFQVDSGGFQPAADVDFLSRGAVDLRGLAYSASLKPVFSTGGGKVVVGGITIGAGTIYGYGVSSFGAASDGAGGTLITLNPEPTWTANSGGTLSGDWTDPTHWTTGVPATTQDAAIGPGITSSTAWIIGVGSSDVVGIQNLLLANSKATLAAGGVLSVTNALTVQGGADVSLAPSGAVVVGGASSVAGAIAIAAGSGVTAGAGDVFTAAVADAGTLVVTNDPFGNRPGSATITGAFGGAGNVVEGSGTLAVGSFAGFTGAATVAGDLAIGTGDGAGGTFDIALNATVDLLGLAFAGSAPSYDASSGLLTLGGDTLDVGPGQPAGIYQAIDDKQGGTAIINVGTLGSVGAPCFVAGTRLRGEHAEIPVELVRPGDRLLTAGGRLAAVTWVGWSGIDLAQHPAPQHAAPVRITAGALADGVPCRDLLVSPDHAIAIGRALVPAHLLCNGASIRTEAGLAHVTYVHVELDRHDLLLAEGAPAESYLETGNRGLFAGSTGVRKLHPDLRRMGDAAAARAAYAIAGCAPLLLGGRPVRQAHARLRARAEALGWHVTTDAALGIEGDMPGLAATPFGDDGVHLFLPPGATTLRLRSRSFVPNEFDPRAGDGRRLGVAVSVRRDHKPIAARAYAQGWHPPEPGCAWRWTDGDALLRIAPRSREVKLTLKVMQASARYWAPPPEPLSETTASPAARPARRAR